MDFWTIITKKSLFSEVFKNAANQSKQAETSEILHAHQKKTRKLACVYQNEYFNYSVDERIMKVIVVLNKSSAIQKNEIKLQLRCYAQYTSNFSARSHGIFVLSCIWNFFLIRCLRVAMNCWTILHTYWSTEPHSSNFIKSHFIHPYENASLFLYPQKKSCSLSIYNTRKTTEKNDAHV